LLHKIETEEGTIFIEKPVIGRIILEEVKKLKGRVWVSSHKGKVPGLVSRIGGQDEMNYLEISNGQKGIDIRVYVVIRFGTSIGEVTNQLLDSIQESVKRYTDINPNSVAVIVTGMVSKQLAKRNIEVKR
jgi:uncharacterized alkaline shock family protein YloU